MTSARQIDVEQGYLPVAVLTVNIDILLCYTESIKNACQCTILCVCARATNEPGNNGYTANFTIKLESDLHVQAKCKGVGTKFSTGFSRLLFPGLAGHKHTQP